MTSERGVDQDWPFIQRAQNGNPEAFGIIYNRWLGPMTAYVARKVHGNDRDVEDLVASVFLKTWESIDTLTPIAPFGAYLYRVAHNLVVNHYREIASSNRAIIETSELPSQIISLTGDPVVVCQNRETIEELQNALDKLPLRQRIAVIGHHIEGLHLDEIAHLLDIKRGAAKSIIRRGLTSLGRYLQPPTRSEVA